MAVGFYNKLIINQRSFLWRWIYITLVYCCLNWCR